MIVNFSLRRDIKPIILFGLPELQLMIEELLINSASSGRLMSLMRIIELLLLCFCAVRPSSLGPCNPDMEAQGKVSRPVRHPRILRKLTVVYTVPTPEGRLFRQSQHRRVSLRSQARSPQFQGMSSAFFFFSTSLTVHLPEQGFNQGKAGLQNFILTSPELPQHVMFDLPTLMLLYFFYRGALPSHLKTWDDVLRSEDMEIHVREEVRDEPL